MKNPLSRTARAAGTSSAAEAADAQTDAIDLSAELSPRPRRRRTFAIVAGVAALAVLGSGAAVANSAHKTITLDVDGEVTEVTTWRGSVENLLAEQEINVGSRDVIAPSPTTALKDGSEVVVRYGRLITVGDGEDLSQMWTTAVDADEILTLLAARGDDVHLVASRSADRAEVGIPLPADETANILVDDETMPVPAGIEKVDEALVAADITLEDLDRVKVRRLDSAGEPVEASEPGVVTIVVERVVVKEEKKEAKVKHKTVTETDATRFKDLPIVVKAEGAKGVRTTKHEVTYVDGVEESRVELSKKVTTKPKTRILVKGTKARPVVVAPAPKASSGSGKSRSGSGKSSSGSAKPKANQGAAPTSGVWAQLAQCESGGNPSIVSASGAYHGLYQFSPATWRSVGGSGLPSQASAAEQTKRAKILQARSGWGQWPACTAKMGLR